MINKTKNEFERITSASCDSCGDNIKLDIIGRLPDHMTIGGYHEGMLLEAIVCIKCMNDKLGFINIQKKRSTLGNC